MTKVCLECQVNIHEDEQGRNLNDDGTFHICKSSQLVNDTLQAITERSFSGRHPELGKMINCKFCGHRHRENERNCKQVFAKDENGIDRTVPQTRKGIYGAAMFAKRRVHPRQRSKQPIHYWLRIILEAAKRRMLEQSTNSSSSSEIPIKLVKKEENNGPDNLPQ